jgi:hypothetical protein
MTPPQVLAEGPFADPTPNGAAPPPVADVSQHGAAARAPRASKTPRAADWKVSEAPASCCLKWRIGTLEVLYTARGATDAEIQPRITALLPWLQALLSEVQAHAVLQTEASAAVQGPPAPPAPAAPPPPASPPEAWCAIHQVRMGRHSNANGTWYSHRLGDGTYCKGT